MDASTVDQIMMFLSAWNEPDLKNVIRKYFKQIKNNKLNSGWTQLKQGESIPEGVEHTTINGKVFYRTPPKYKATQNKASKSTYDFALSNGKLYPELICPVPGCGGTSIHSQSYCGATHLGKLGIRREYTCNRCDHIHYEG